MPVTLPAVLTTPAAMEAPVSLVPAPKEKPTSGRLAVGIQIYGNALAEPNFDKIDQLKVLAKERGHSVSELAIASLLSHKCLGSVVAGPTSPHQLSANAAASSWTLTAEDVTQVEKII